MKRFLFVFLALLFSSTQTFCLHMTGVNSYPYEYYSGPIMDNNLKKQSTFETVINGVIIVKNIYVFNSAYKFGKPYEYIITNNTKREINLSGVVQQNFLNRDIRNSSNWFKMRLRYFKYWQSYVPLYDLIHGGNMSIERYPFVLDFPVDYNLSPGESLRILAMGLDLDKVQNLTFIFEDNGEEVKIEF